MFTQLPADFENKISQPDLLVVFTSTCSHKMLAGIRNRSEKCGILVEHVHSASVRALKNLLECYEVKRHVGIKCANLISVAIKENNMHDYRRTARTAKFRKIDTVQRIDRSASARRKLTRQNR